MVPPRLSNVCPLRILDHRNPRVKSRVWVSGERIFAGRKAKGAASRRPLFVAGTGFEPVISWLRGRRTGQVFGRRSLEGRRNRMAGCHRPADEILGWEGSERREVQRTARRGP